jgi:hypothetical protein
MICLVDIEETPAVGIMTRIRRARGGYRGLTSGYRVILGIRTLNITIDVTPSMPLKTIQKRIKYAAERMHAVHAGKVLFSDKFPYRELLLREGFDEMDEGRLLELLAGKIISEYSGSDKVAAFFARHITGEAERIFCDMCRYFKYVMAAVESDSGWLMNILGRQLGISVIGQPTQRQLSKADVAVFFDPPEQRIVLPEKCIAIPVNDAALDGVVCSKAVSGLTVELSAGITQDVPVGFAHEPLIAAALDTGTLRREDVRVRDIRISDMYA